MKNRIYQTGMINWRQCEWLQPEGLKKQTAEEFQKLKKSMTENGFASLFYVWDDPETGKTYILDGHHRKKVLKHLEVVDGVVLPDEFPAAWVDCKNKHEALKFIMIYSSQYARIRDDSLFEFLSDFRPEEILDQISIPNIDLNDLYVSNENIKPDAVEVDENKIKLENECPQCGYQW